VLILTQALNLISYLWEDIYIFHQLILYKINKMILIYRIEIIFVSENNVLDGGKIRKDIALVNSQ